MPAEKLAEQHKARLAGRYVKQQTRKQKIAGYRANFMFFDIDQSGSLSVSEFYQLLTRHHGSAAGLTQADAQELLDLFDSDGNGRLDVEEFISAMISMDPELAAEEAAAEEAADDSLFAAASKIDASKVASHDDDRQTSTEYA